MDLWNTVIGVDESPERQAEILAVFEAIGVEIRKLRTLDLTDEHPAIVFDPTDPAA